MDDLLHRHIVAAQRGDREAFARLYDRFARVVHAIVLARVAYRDAADLVQDVFVRALERVHELETPDAFPGWITSIARNRAIDFARSERPQAPSLELAAQPVPSAEAKEVLAAIQSLPDAYRETLIMRLVEGLTGPEIADRCGLQPGSVRVNLCRGMELLREKLR